MKVYLLNPPYYPHFGRGARWQDTGRGGTLYYPIWLSYATALLEEDNEVRLVDAPAWGWDKEDVIKDIGIFKPNLLVIDSSFPSLNNDINVAESIKRSYNEIKIVLVGPPASQFSEKILESNGIDIVARWEYDFTLKEVAEKFENGDDWLKDIKGISFKKDGKVIHSSDRAFSTSEDLDKIPFVSKVYKKHLHINDYFLGQSLYPEVQIFTGRGCPNRCTFCSWPQTLMGRKYRYRSVSNLLDEVEWIGKNLSVKEIFFEDDTFTLSKNRVLEFCKGYRDRKLKIVWACNARVDSLDLETMKAMKKANCRLLIAGYESGSDVILKNVKKGITVDQIKEFSKNAKKARLLVHGDIIFGLPGETKETINKTKQLIRTVKPDILQVAVASPFPGTEFYEYCKNNSCLLTNDPNKYLDEKGHQKAIISYPALSNEDMVSEVNTLLKNYYLSLQYVPLAFNQIFRKNGFQELKRLLFSAKMFLGYVNEK
ncbi:Fe-S oxidoreductase [Methanosarcina horonobensis HB-1 = JCM 15518]|uniref:Fe-S oxidoreductase n=1 Tax=Methanosarcina horonobensis HB-1 = JCM 15518 TaxID=1434110 RepID=A0A0E3S7X0_9EURY|nr:B12-binding domain-containing radical SAM protein [Methanosarcina horonobensis]AKB76666.1 Fe-S oxidoreductase [Methanosarcina horonobensis HB-1 = JCM 15518]